MTTFPWTNLRKWSYPPLTFPKEWPFSIGHAQENEHPPLVCPKEWEHNPSLGTPKGMTILSWHAQEGDPPLFGLAYGKNLIFMNSTTSNVLNPNLPIPFRRIKILQGPTKYQV
jgi:hypothetical protein